MLTKTIDKFQQLISGNRHSLLLAIDVERLSIEPGTQEIKSGVYSISKEDIEEVIEPMKEDGLDISCITDLSRITLHEQASAALAKILQRRSPVQAFDEVIG